jgi:hypothetical protein
MALEAVVVVALMFLGAFQQHTYNENMRREVPALLNSLDAPEIMRIHYGDINAAAPVKYCLNTNGVSISESEAAWCAMKHLEAAFGGRVIVLKKRNSIAKR